MCVEQHGCVGIHEIFREDPLDSNTHYVNQLSNEIVIQGEGVHREVKHQGQEQDELPDCLLSFLIFHSHYESL